MSFSKIINFEACLKHVYQTIYIPFILRFKEYKDLQYSTTVQQKKGKSTRRAYASIPQNYNRWTTSDEWSVIGSIVSTKQLLTA